MSPFSSIPLLPDDPILSLGPLFLRALLPDKVNLGIGTYKDEKGRPVVFDAVKQAEVLLAQENRDKEYLPIVGEKSFCEKVMKQLILGRQHHYSDIRGLVEVQALGGSAALRLAAEFLSSFITKTIYMTKPTWSNHEALFSSGGLNYQYYPYYDIDKHELVFEEMMRAIEQMDEGTAILFHGNCHNPSGFDPTKEQWNQILDAAEKKRLIPLFDVAYQGFGESIDDDVYPVRRWLEKGKPLILCYSCSKNFGLYGERVGMLAIVTFDDNVVPALYSQLKQRIRGYYSSPPLHGVRIVDLILKTASLKDSWEKQLTGMRKRLQNLRSRLVEAFRHKSGGHRFDFIARQKGLFFFSGLSQGQVMKLREERAIYMPVNGRVNIAGINDNNIDYVVESILDS